MPCNFGLRALADHVKAGVRAAGGTPMEFNTIAISDGITMGTEGMKASLVSRELIADSIELVARGYGFDAIVALVACDKTIPAAGMALLRLDVPGSRAVRRLDRAGSLQGPRSHDRRRVRSDRRARGRQDRRCGAARDRVRGVSGRRRVRRTVHREHDGDRVRVPRPLDGRQRKPRRDRSAQGEGGLSRGRHRDGDAARGTYPTAHRDARRVRERDRGRDGHRRFDEQRAAPDRDGARGRRAAVARRLRTYLGAHADRRRLCAPADATSRSTSIARAASS